MRFPAAAIGLCVALAAASAVAGASEPNDTFPTRTLIACATPTGTFAHADGISGGLPAWPDTTLGAFDAGGGLLTYNDDASPLGDGRASALYDVAINADGSVRLKVSGYGDLNFNGMVDYWDDPLKPPVQWHEHSGPYELYVQVYDAGGAVQEEWSYSHELTAAAVDTVPTHGGYAPGWFDAEIDNTVGGPTGSDPLDFVGFTGLAPGMPFTAEITSAEFDTMLGLFDGAGALVAYDDESGTGSLSRLAGVVPAGGEVSLCISGWDDAGFEGFHAESGAYTLELTVVPEPAALSLLAVGACLVCLRRRRA